ncbi:MAG TPA: hypothetical protein VNI57_00750, partial [Candidatus Saccharimonadales bacterium]|nr:hypothetical protein [Candidatus Saccharimonadales bacterium]
IHCTSWGILNRTCENIRQLRIMDSPPLVTGITRILHRAAVPVALVLVALVLAGSPRAQENQGDANSREESAEGGNVAPLAERFRPLYGGRIFTLKIDLHQAESGGHPAPWLDKKGWHRRDIRRPTILRAGTQVEVTGIFDYGDRSIFLELTEYPTMAWNGPPVRMRIRIKAESGPAEPGDQDEEIERLIALVLSGD